MIFNPNTMPQSGGGGYICGSFTGGSSVELDFDKPIAAILFFGPDVDGGCGMCGGEFYWVIGTSVYGSTPTPYTLGRVSSSDRKHIVINNTRYWLSSGSKTISYIAFPQT